MSVKFTPPGPASYFTAPVASFDGLSRTCKQYGRARGGVMRCKKFKQGKGTPPCGPIKRKNLRVGRGPGGTSCRK